MGVYGYCVVPYGHAPESSLTGIADAVITLRTVGQLGVWVSQIERPAPDIKYVESHNSVIEAAVSDAVTPVPLRFGQWSDDAAAFDRLIAEKEDWYHDRLKAFAGALEFGMRIALPEDTGQAQVVHNARPTSGREYMDALRANASAASDARAQGERVRAEVNEILGRVVLEERYTEAKSPRGLIDLAHLVARPDFEEYRASAQSLRGRFPEMRFLMSGPWVPYSFAV